jgi:hypothetical protein
MCLPLIRSPGSLCGTFRPCHDAQDRAAQSRSRVRCLEIRGGHGLIARWLREHVGRRAMWPRPIWRLAKTARSDANVRGLDIVADAELDTGQPGTVLAEFYRLSMPSPPRPSHRELFLPERAAQAGPNANRRPSREPESKRQTKRKRPQAIPDGGEALRH